MNHVYAGKSTAPSDIESLRIDTRKSKDLSDDAPLERSAPEKRLLRKRAKKKEFVYEHNGTARSTEAFIKRMQGPRLAKSVSFSSAPEQSWRNSKLSASMAVEREKVDEKYERSHQVYGSRYRNSANYFAQLDFHSTKLEDKYRELKELITGDQSEWPQQELVLKEARGVLRSLRVLPNDVTTPGGGDGHYFQPELPSQIGLKQFFADL